MKNKVCLVIIDGFATGNLNSKSNAYALAKAPNLNRIMLGDQVCELQASGLAVGLPSGQMGNSEVGHMAIGSGRILDQFLVKINKNLLNSESLEWQECSKTITESSASSESIHLFCLMSEGGIHAHIDHAIKMISFLEKETSSDILIHFISDGRDSVPGSVIHYLSQIKGVTNKRVKIATVAGRFYAMDRDNRDERTQCYFDCCAGKSGDIFQRDDIISVVEGKINNKETDEFIVPMRSSDYNGIKDNDTLLFMNFRSDRMRQVVDSFLRLKNVNILTMVDYFNGARSDNLKTLFSKDNVTESLGELISRNNLNQIRISETEKYPHVTYFFNGGEDRPFSGEDRKMINSPKVKSYDEKPEMSGFEVIEVVRESVKKHYDFILVNFANCDMVGHTGNIDASVKAVEFIDYAIEKILIDLNAEGYTTIITADHGNVEEMRNQKGEINTKHTLNNVPCAFISKNKFNLQNGSLQDIAPTVLNLLDIPISSLMTGKSLIR